MTGAANRSKGHRAERAVVGWLRGHGFPEASTTRARLGHDGFSAPGDVLGVPGLVIEVKSVLSSAWPTWCRQAHAEAHNTPWVVVRRQEFISDVAKWPCIAICTALPQLRTVGAVVPPRVALPEAWRRDEFVGCAIPGLPPLYAGRFGQLFDEVKV